MSGFFIGANLGSRRAAAHLTEVAADFIIPPKLE
jgi:hypothetical protein